MKALMLTWLFQSALLGGGLLTAGCFLAARCRSPIRRLRLLDWTLVAALTAPILASIEGPWHLPLRWLPGEPASAATTAIASAPLQAEIVLADPAPAAYEHESGPVRAVKPVLRDPIIEQWTWPDWRDVVLAIEALAIILLAAKWFLSALALAFLSSSAKAVDAQLVDRINERLSTPLPRSVTIRLDPNMSTPCVFGLFRPCILLPEFLARAERAQQMIFALAHEASHILRGDLWSWRLVRLGQFALWFQPAYWWLRRQTRLCQDFLADQDASTVGKPADLADFLVQLARIQQSPLAVPALSMCSGGTDLSRRVKMLLHSHSELERRCPRRVQASLAMAVFSIIGLSAVLRLEAQDRGMESRSKEPPALPGLQSAAANVTQVRGRVLGPDGKPVSEAKLYLGAVSKDEKRQPVLRIYQKEMESALRATSDTDGHFGFTFSNAELMEMAREDLKRIRFPELVGEVMAVAPGHGCGWAEIDGAAKELTIHLVDDFPVAGRILDSDGHPVAAARISLTGIGAAPREDLSPLLMAAQKDEGLKLANAFVEGGLFSTVWNGSLPGQPAITTAGRDGRFRLSGIGRDRLVGICIEGPSIATDFRWVMTRTGETVKLPLVRSIFAASFDFVGQPSRLITGTVRNKATGKPMGGVTVDLGGIRIRSVTDHNGRYELRGAPKGPIYQLVATPGDGLFFERTVKLQDTPGLDSLRCDIELVSGLTAHGRVTEKEAGKPVADARVEYHPVAGNLYVNKLLPGPWWPRSETTSSPDGSYTLTVMPGPGFIGVRGEHLNAYAPAVATVKERKHFFKSRLPPYFNNDDNGLDIAEGGTTVLAMPVNSYDALVLIEPGEEEPAVVKDASLERPQELRGRVLGPDSQRLTGTTVSGLGRFGYEKLSGSDFTVRGVNPKGKRSLVFYHKEKQLGYYLKNIDVKSAEPITVKLERCGSVSGRILDEDGQPVAGAQVYVMGSTFRNGSEEDGGYHLVATDANGRFHIVGLVPDLEYSVEYARFYAVITVEAGQNKDLGDIKVQRPNR